MTQLEKKKNHYNVEISYYEDPQMKRYVTAKEIAASPQTVADLLYTTLERLDRKEIILRHILIYLSEDSEIGLG